MTTKCECGVWTGEMCDWAGSLDETVVIEYMPPDLRASHAAAANYGVYPHNGAVRVRVSRDCADLVAGSEWASVVEAEG